MTFMAGLCSGTYTVLCVVVALLTFSGVASQSIRPITVEPEVFVCQNLTKVTTCVDLGLYNHTAFPNFRGQESQEEANTELLNFQPLIDMQCSSSLVLMLCAVYAPFCATNAPQIRVRPCKELCVATREGCEDSLNEFGLDWPPHLVCDQYPSMMDDITSFCPPNIGTFPPPTMPPTGQVTTPPPTSEDGICPYLLPPELIEKSYVFDGIDDCGVSCSGLYYSPTERRTIAPAVILVFALLCVGFTLFTVATFLIDRRRFHYPERPIIFLSFGYLIISVTYIVGAVSKLVGDDTSFACTQNFTKSRILPEPFQLTAPIDTVVFQHLPNSDTSYESASCVILFVLVYYFQMASSLWWVILTLTWFLAAALKWGEEAVEKLWLLYHILAWGIPAVQVILVLALQLVDGDQLAGICFVGNQNDIGLGVFVFLPQLIYLVLGLIFFVIGFGALVNIRRQVQRDHSKSRKLGLLILRIGVYTALYSIPIVIQLILYLYELSQRRDWMISYVRSECFENGNCDSSPSFGAILIRYLTIFFVGIFSTSWIISQKTFLAWHRFFCSCGCRNQPNYDLPEKQDHGIHNQTAI